MMTYSEMPPRPPRPPVAAFCKCSSGLAGLLQMIIRIGWPFANAHPDGLAFSKMIIFMGRSFANDHLDWLAFSK